MCDTNGTPDVNKQCTEKQEFSRSPNLLGNLQVTPVKNSDGIFKHSTGCFSVLPNHLTPPSGLTKFIARNPFERDLTNRLHLSVISPSVFTKTSSPAAKSPNFSWNIEELAVLQPAKIDEFPVQQMHCSDEDLERRAQEAINIFFHENHIIPSPWDARQKTPGIKLKLHTPTRPTDEFDITRESLKSKKDAWTQTVLSLPPTLPKEVEKALEPYFTFTQEQNVDADESNSSNNSLRRKLFFNHDDQEDDDEYCSISSPSSSLVHTGSPPQSGMLILGTPLKRLDGAMTRDYETPSKSTLSPPNMSPIFETPQNMSVESIKSRRKSAVQLNFSVDMSIDASFSDNKENIDSSVIAASHNSNKCVNLFNRFEQEATVELCEETPMSQETTPLKTSIFLQRDDNCDAAGKKLSGDWCKTMSSSKFASFPNVSTFSGTFGQQSTFGTTQDTGYQTYSNSNSMDSYNLTPIKNKINWNDQTSILPNEDDWKGNMKHHMFSSTPSRYQREMANLRNVEY